MVNKNFLSDLLAGETDYSVLPNLGDAIFAPSDISEDAPIRFQSVTSKIIANEGFGYVVAYRLTHRDSRCAENYIHQLVINTR